MTGSSFLHLLMNNVQLQLHADLELVFLLQFFRQPDLLRQIQLSEKIVKSKLDQHTIREIHGACKSVYQSLLKLYGLSKILYFGDDQYNFIFNEIKWSCAIFRFSCFFQIPLNCLL